MGWVALLWAGWAAFAKSFHVKLRARISSKYRQM